MTDETFFLTLLALTLLASAPWLIPAFGGGLSGWRVAEGADESAATYV